MLIVPELWIAFTNICFEKISLLVLLDSILPKLREHFIMLLQSCVLEQFQKRRKRKGFLFYVGFHLFIWEGKFLQKSMVSDVLDACVMALILSSRAQVFPTFIAYNVDHSMKPLLTDVTVRVCPRIRLQLHATSIANR